MFCDQKRELNFCNGYLSLLYFWDGTANRAKFEWKWAGSHNVFQIFRTFFTNYFIKNPQSTIALTFLTHIISGIDGVCNPS